MIQSKRHHYIPELIIKGFAGEDNKLAVYNLTKKKIEPLRKSPKQVFYEWNRNTFDINGKKTDFVEGLYNVAESNFSPVYKKIVKQSGPISLDPEDLLHLILFLGIVYWRVPDRDKTMQDFMKNATNKDLLFKLQNRRTGKEASKELYTRIMSEPAFIESSKIIKAIHDYLKTDIVSKIRNWNIYYSATNVHLHVLGDNPIISRDSKNSNIFETELIFPLTKGKTVYHTNGKTIQKLPAEHRISVDILIFLQSRIMVCGPNEHYLQTIADAANIFQKEDRISALKESVFRVFE